MHGLIVDVNCYSFMYVFVCNILFLHTVLLKSETISFHCFHLSFIYDYLTDDT